MEVVSKESQKYLNRTNIPWSDELKNITEKIKKDPHNPELWLEKGHAFAKQFMMREAVEAYSMAITFDPMCGIYYRWRGHRLLNLGEVSEAGADFIFASRLIPENWDVWYHLAICYVLMGNYSLAELAMLRCSETNTEEKGADWARYNWTWIALRHQGKEKEAAELLTKIPENMECESGTDYLNNLMFYKGLISEQDLLNIPDSLTGDELSNAITNACNYGFGIANYYLVNGNEAKYRETIDYILEIGSNVSWSCLGYIGASYYRRKKDLVPQQVLTRNEAVVPQPLQALDTEKAKRTTQFLPDNTVEFSDEIKEFDDRINNLYSFWNVYDILPDVCDLLRRRSDAAIKQKLVRESISSLSEAMLFDPMSGLNFSMRGRRYMNCGDYERACADHAMAVRQIPENWYMWYHYGLCLLVVGETERAEYAYKKCAEIPTTETLDVALKFWMWIALMRAGKEHEAQALIGDVKADTVLEGTDNYKRCILLYKGKDEMTPEQLLTLPKNDKMPELSLSIQSFGLACYYQAKGDMEKYKTMLKFALDNGREAWTCYAYAAAEYEWIRLQGNERLANTK